MHGAGETSTYYEDLYRQGKFPKNDDVKIMFLQSHLKQGSRYPWMKTNSSYSSMDPNARSIEDGDKQCESIVQIIRDEITNTYGFLSFSEAAKRIYIAGKSQGALLSLYLQLMKLKTTFGGIGVFSGFPIKPLYEMTYDFVTASEAKAQCTNLQQDMRFFFWHGTKDTVFDQEKTFALYKVLFNKLGISGTIKKMHAETGLTHKTSVSEIKSFMKFIDEVSVSEQTTEAFQDVIEEEPMLLQ